MIERFCDEADIEEVERVLHGGWFFLDDTLAGLEYLEEQEACRISLDLGDLDSLDAGVVCRLLLEWNFHNAHVHAPVLGVEPGSGRIALTQVLPLALLEEVGLLEVLDEDVAPLLEAWEDLRDGIGQGCGGIKAALPPEEPSSGDFV